MPQGCGDADFTFANGSVAYSPILGEVLQPPLPTRRRAKNSINNDNKNNMKTIVLIIRLMVVLTIRTIRKTESAHDAIWQGVGTL